MLKGFSTPLSPAGRSSLAPMPPWHYAGTGLVIDTRTDADAVAAVLPPGLEPDKDDPGRSVAHFFDWQACTDGGAELVDPSRSQYREFFVLVAARLDGQPVMYCPYIIVDQDISLMRGLIQGLPKQIGSVWMTRAQEVEGVAAPQVGPGGRFGATLAMKERRLAEATVTLRETADKAPGLTGGLPVVGMRYFPELTRDLRDRPPVHELVRFAASDRRLSQVWRGDATLSLFPSPIHELADLAPREILGGYRYAMSMSVDDLVKLKDLRG
ncbi:MAG: acetoacetate decarboxylase family protein [Actinomycetota bacterium]